MPRYAPTAPCPVCFLPAGAQEACADCGWPRAGSPRQAGTSGGEAEERRLTAELERAQRRYDSVAAARFRPVDGRDLPYIRGGRPDEGEWAAAVWTATVAPGSLDTPDHLREVISRRIKELPEAGRLCVVEVGRAGIATTMVSVDTLGVPRVDRRPAVPWTDLAPMLPAESPDELLFRLAGGFGGVDRTGLWSTLDRTVPEAAVIPAHHQVLVCTALGWPVPERALEVLARRDPETPQVSPVRVDDVNVAELVAEQVSRLDAVASLRGTLELVVARIIADNKQVVLRSERLFGAGAQVGAERDLTIWCPHADDEGIVLAVVHWDEDTRPRPASVDSVRLRPGSLTLRAVLAGPGRVKFVEPPGVVPELRPWSQLMATMPRRYVPPVGDFDLVCALDLGADGFDDRRALVSELVELLRCEYPGPGRFRVAVVGYRSHEFRVGRETKKVVYGRWLDSPDEAQRSLDRFHAFEPGPTLAAPVEDALEVIARGVAGIPAARKVVLLTVGERPPHPPAEEPGGEIPCPHEYDWRSLLTRIQGRRGGQTSVAVLDSAAYLGDAWQRIGKTARQQLSKTDPRKLAVAAGLVVPPTQRLSFPLLEPPE